jgi:hypothetical protein
MAGPHFFVDRSLGRHRVPNLLREDGWSLVTLAEHYGIPQTKLLSMWTGWSWPDRTDGRR